LKQEKQLVYNRNTGAR